MARLLEHEAKAALAGQGVRVPAGIVARYARAEAEEAARRLGGGACFVKALVPANRRGVAGGVLRADGPRPPRARPRAPSSACRSWAPTPDAVLVEAAVEIERELYLAVAARPLRGGPVALASCTAARRSRRTWRPGAPPSCAARSTRGAASSRTSCGSSGPRRGWTGPALAPVAAVSTAVARAALALDATLLEINPLALTPDGPLCVGALLEVDDDARSRQGWLPPEDDWSPAAWRPATDRERQARASADADPHRGTARFVEIDGGGDIGLVTGGGGASLVVFDAVRRAGGSPAAYTEVGGNPTAAKVQGLTRAVLDCPGVRGLLVAHNLTSNTQVDLVAEGVLAALAERGLDAATFPVVAREVGTHDRAGRAALEAAGVETLGEDVGLEAAAARIVERVAGAPA